MTKTGFNNGKVGLGIYYKNYSRCPILMRLVAR